MYINIYTFTDNCICMWLKWLYLWLRAALGPATAAAAAVDAVDAAWAYCLCLMLNDSS